MSYCDDHMVEPIDVQAMTQAEREAYARGIEAAANQLALGPGNRLHFVSMFRNWAAGIRSTH